MDTFVWKKQGEWELVSVGGSGAVLRFADRDSAVERARLLAECTGGAVQVFDELGRIAFMESFRLRRR